MNLHETILDAARDEVAKKYGWSNWKDGENAMLTHISNEETIEQRTTEAALLAMEIQGRFKDWQIDQFKATLKRKGIPFHDLTDQEDYLVWKEIWKEGKGE